MTTNTTARPCACTSVRRTARVLARTFDSALADSGLNITQLAVMRGVLRHPHEPLSRVAEDLAMDRTSLYRALGALEKQRWITLSDGADSRSRTASVTTDEVPRVCRQRSATGELFETYRSIEGL